MITGNLCSKHRVQYSPRTNQARQQYATREKLKYHDEIRIPAVSLETQPDTDIYDAEQAEVANQ
jgi:hypothetical protein